MSKANEAREPMIGDAVWFWHAGTPKPAQLVEKGILSGLWAVNIFRTGSMYPAREVEFSEDAKDGCWTWMGVPMPEPAKPTPIYEESAAPAPVKRGRGRPKKNPEAVPPANDEGADPVADPDDSSSREPELAAAGD